MKTNIDRIKTYGFHGFQIKGDSGNQVYGNCIFCGSESKFYCNKENYLWDCKKCGLKGNVSAFLENLVRKNKEDLSEKRLLALCQDRKLPKEAFENLDFGYCEVRNHFTFPVRDEKDTIVDVRCYRIGKRVMGTSGCRTGLIGLNNLNKVSKEWPIYLCEGEWDWLAMRWLILKLKKEVLPLGVPGACVMKREWVEHFENRKVKVLYDNDGAGESGELIVKSKLQGYAKSISYLHWLDGLKEGYDIRDLIVENAIEKKKPKKTYKTILKLLNIEPRKKELKERKTEETSVEAQEESIPEKRSLIQVREVFNKWLFLKSFEPIEVMLATVLSNKLEGDPLWLFLVAPPGGAKTEILSSLGMCKDVYFTSSLTPHSLISGANFAQGGDPSLIPKLDGKVLAIKDFTSIMAKRDVEKEEIFGILRDAYDGKCSKVFGNGVRRNYVSKFTIISAVTPAIYELSHSHQALGERFVKYVVGGNLHHVSERSVVERAIGNLNQETTMRKELTEVVYGFMYYLMENFDPENIAVIPSNIVRQLVPLAMLCARMRGTISRDRFRPDMINSKPSAEVGSRLGKQLAKFCISLAMVRGKKEVTEEEYSVCKKIALNTISQRNEDLLRCLYLETGMKEKSLKTKEICFQTKYPFSTVSRVLSDMQMLKIISRLGLLNSHEWKITNYIKKLIEKSGVYKS